MKHIATSVTAFFFLLAVAAFVYGEPAVPEAVCSSASTGNWTAAATWTGCGGGTPQPGDGVVIGAAHSITFDSLISITISSLTINGTLTFDNSANHVLIVSGNVTINTGGTIKISGNATHALNIGGNWTDNGTFNGYHNGNRYIDVTFNGSGQQTISGSSALAMRDLRVNGGSRVIFPATNLPTVNGAMTVNAGGAVQQTQTVNNGPVNFIQISTSAYRGVDLNTANNLGSTTVVITTTASDSCTTTGTGSPAYATRCYEITPANNLTATVRLYALTATQLNGVAQANLRVYRYAGGWQQLTTNALTGSATGGYSYAQADTPGFSDFLLGGLTAPTAIKLSTFDAQSSVATWPVPIGLVGLTMAGLGLALKRRSQPHA